MQKPTLLKTVEAATEEVVADAEAEIAETVEAATEEVVADAEADGC